MRKYDGKVLASVYKLDAPGRAFINIFNRQISKRCKAFETSVSRAECRPKELLWIVLKEKCAFDKAGKLINKRMKSPLRLLTRNTRISEICQLLFFIDWLKETSKFYIKAKSYSWYFFKTYFWYKSNLYRTLFVRMLEHESCLFRGKLDANISKCKNWILRYKIDYHRTYEAIPVQGRWTIWM